MKNMRIYVVGLETNFRGERLLKQLESLNLKYVRINAVNGSSISATEKCRLYDSGLSRLFMGRDLSCSEIACFLSHQLSYVDLLSSEAQYAMVLEDDAVIADSQNVLQLVEFLARNSVLKNRPTIIHLDGSHEEEFETHASVCIFRIPYPIYRTHAYIVNRKAVKLLLNKESVPIYTTADWPPNAFKLSWWLASKPLVVTNDAPSLIQPSRLDKQKITYRTLKIRGQGWKAGLNFIQRALGLYLFDSNYRRVRNFATYFWFLPRSLHRLRNLSMRKLIVLDKKMTASDI